MSPHESVRPAQTHELLEREVELAALETLYSEAAAGRGRIALVTGEAGGGKTALLDQFCAEPPRPTRVLRGFCDALFTPRPLGPIVDIASQMGPQLSALVHADVVPFTLATALIDDLRRRGPTVLVIEDAHWADEATLDVLRLMARRIDSVSALIVVSFREDAIDPSHPLRLVLGELGSGLTVARVPLAPLSPDAVARLSESYGVDPVELHRVTGGNPFFVTEVLASTGSDIPATVRDAVLSRAARLTPGARTLLEVVAIAVPHAELRFMEALSGDIDERLDECIASGMLVSSGDSVAFRHELARLAVEGSTATGRRLNLHRAALKALASREDADLNLARLAYHADAAGDRDAVIRFAPAAGARASTVGAHREAAEHYARALRYSQGLGPKELAELLERRSRECYLTDRADEAIDALRGATSCYRELGDRAAEGKTLATLSTILWCPGRGEEARRTAFEAVRLLEQLPPGPELVDAYANLSFQLARVADADAARQWGVLALDLAERVGDPVALCEGLYAVAQLEPTAESGAPTAVVERLMVLAEQSGVEERVGDAYLMLAGSAAARHLYGVADGYIESGLTYCREHGIDLLELYLLALRARTELERGRWEEAAASAERVLARRAVSTQPRTQAFTVLALVRARRRDPGVTPLLAEARALADPTGELPRIAPVAVAAAEVAWLHGDSDGVRTATDDAFERAVRTGSAYEIGEIQAWRRRGGIHEPMNPGAGGTFALELVGDPASAAAVWSKIGRPYEAALALADEGSEAALRQSLDGLTALGARAAAAIVSRRLRELGASDIRRGPRAATRSNVGGLTPRELEVLRLVSEGLQNTAIGAQLFLSPRTVDNHVSAILRKLDARTRAEAAAKAARLGLLEDR